MTKQQQNHLEFALERLLDWLNWEKAPVDDFRKLTDLLVKRSLEAAGSDPRDYQAVVQWDRKLAPICRRIAQRFPTYSVPVIIVDTRTGKGVPYIDRRPLRKIVRDSYDLSACFAIGHLFELFSAGMLGNIRRCEWQGARGAGRHPSPPCRRYFYGRLGKRFCSGACKRKSTRRTEKFQEMNALHQKVHYRSEKVKDLKELAAMSPAYQKDYKAAQTALEKVRKLAKRTKKRLASKGR